MKENRIYYVRDESLYTNGSHNPRMVLNIQERGNIVDDIKEFLEEKLKIDENCTEKLFKEKESGKIKNIFNELIENPKLNKNIKEWNRSDYYFNNNILNILIFCIINNFLFWY